jgi:hypothetical protein
MEETHDVDDEASGQSLSERLLDLFVFLPTGLAVTVAEELPRLAERGRERFGVQVDSARAVGHFAVSAGTHELKRRSAGLARTSSTPSSSASPEPSTGASASGASRPPRLRTIPYPPDHGTDPAAPGATSTGAPTTRSPATAPVSTTRSPATTRPPVDAHVPDVASLAIPGFDTLSASQVVQRLDGLSRSELVAVRAYETSTRGRRTILSRVDQLLDERS